MTTCAKRNKVGEQRRVLPLQEHDVTLAVLPACSSPPGPLFPSCSFSPRSCETDPFQMCDLSVPSPVRDYRRKYFEGISEVMSGGGAGAPGEAAGAS